MNLKLDIMVPTVENIQFLWAKFRANRQFFPAPFIDDPIGFACWVGARSTLIYAVGGLQEPVGVIIFTDIQPKDNAFAHILIWDRRGIKNRELVKAGSMACESTMLAHELHRITTRVPTSNAHAIPLLQAIGFVYEGTLRESLDFGDHRENEEIHAILWTDLQHAVRDTIGMETQYEAASKEAIATR